MTGMNLTIRAEGGMVTIDTLKQDGRFDFSFAAIAGMYQTPSTNGSGCQVNDETLAEDLDAMAQKIVAALEEFGAKHPDSGVFDAATLAIKQKQYSIQG